MMIGIDASRANRKEKTGVEWYAYAVIDALKAILPSDVSVRLYSESPLEGALADLPEHWESKVLAWPMKRLWTQGRLSLEMLLNPPDVLFVPSHVLPLISPQKTVTTIHDIASLYFPEEYSWFQRHYTRFAARLALRNAMRIIVPSRIVSKDLLAWRKEGEADIAVIPLGYQTKHTFSKDGETLPEGIEKPYLLFVGRKEKKKNVLRLIKAFEQYKEKYPESNLQLVLVGKDGFGAEEMHAQSTESSYRHAIQNIAWVEEETLQTLYQQAEAFVFPTLYEGFGIPVLEAISARIPVLTSNNTAAAALVEDAGVLVNPLSVEDIREGLEKLLHDTENRKKMIKKGYKKITKYSWKACAEQTAKLLLEVLEYKKTKNKQQET